MNCTKNDVKQDRLPGWSGSASAIFGRMLWPPSIRCCCACAFCTEGGVEVCAERQGKSAPEKTHQGKQERRGTRIGDTTPIWAQKIRMIADKHAQRGGIAGAHAARDMPIFSAYSVFGPGQNDDEDHPRPKWVHKFRTPKLSNTITSPCAHQQGKNTGHARVAAILTLCNRVGNVINFMLLVLKLSKHLLKASAPN